MPSGTANGRSAGYAACVLALLYAAVSFYWAAGGTAGLGTLGGQLEELGRARDPGIIALVLATGVLKVVAGVIALALVRQWGRALPRRVLLAAAWGLATDAVRRRPGDRGGARGGWCHHASRARRLEGAAMAPLPMGPVVPGVGAPAWSGGLVPHA